MNNIRIRPEVHQALRLEAFTKHESLQKVLDEILSKHFDTPTTPNTKGI